ncbi:MAG: oligosaccharide flippase family protein [Chitinophagaceae bacterium]
MNQKLIKDISASSAQVIFNQVAGAAIFLIVSVFLSKEVYGEFNWSLAVLTFITSILSLRLEQVVIRRIAAGEDASMLLTLFTGHIVFTGLLFYIVLLAGNFIFPSFFKKHDLLLILAVSHLLSFFSSSFKQVANGKENFRVLAWMSSILNLIRAIWLVIVIIDGSLSISQLLSIYIISSLAELIFCVLLSKYRLKTSMSLYYRLKDYLVLIHESLPQAAVVFLNASIARIDWILLGLFTSSIITAEYSFAYKVFELSPFPMLIIAPVLLSRFSRFFSTGSPEQLLHHKQELSLLIRLEMVAATFIPLVLNIIWTPLVDTITHNKYGAVNKTTFLLLSCCIPFLYMNNILWSVHFAQNQLRLILRITLLTFFIILIGDLFLIPIYAAHGAAAVYLVATVTEYMNYMRSSFLSRLRETWLSPLICISAAGICGLLAVYLSDLLYARLLISIPLFFFILLATKQLQKADIRYIVELFRKK